MKIDVLEAIEIATTSIKDWAIEKFKAVQPNWNENDKFSNSYIRNKPSALKNPHSIIFTGSIDSSYDGSESITINIPDDQKQLFMKISDDGYLQCSFDNDEWINLIKTSEIVSSGGGTGSGGGVANIDVDENGVLYFQ